MVYHVVLEIKSFRERFDFQVILRGKALFMIKIIAHRGYWNDSVQFNSKESLKFALEKGFGFETDVRDFLEKLVVSHNIANEKSFDLEYALNLLREYNNQYCFAINIKADGLKTLLNELLSKYQITNYFLFDMSVPQMIEFNDMKLKFFTRQSEVERQLVMYTESNGVWIDGFYSNDWITKELIQHHINNGKRVCIVSPELHKREDYLLFWKTLLDFKTTKEEIMLCTDYPDKAKEFFYGNEN